MSGRDRLADTGPFSFTLDGQGLKVEGVVLRKYPGVGAYCESCSHAFTSSR